MTRMTTLAIASVLALSACSDGGRLLQPSAEPRLSAAPGLGSKIAFTSDWDDPGGARRSMS